MARPRKWDKQKLEAYEIYQRIKDEYGKVSAQDVHTDLESDHGRGNCASYRLVAQWVREWQQRESLIDAPFAWHKLAEYGLPWEAGAFLLEFILRPRVSDPLFGKYWPSARHASWAWRVHCAAPELGPGSRTWYLSKMYAQRELRNEILRQDFDVHDLNVLLVYRPWVSDSHKKAYDNAVAEGLIPPLGSESSVDIPGPQILASGRGLQVLLTLYEDMF